MQPAEKPSRDALFQKISKARGFDWVDTMLKSEKAMPVKLKGYAGGGLVDGVKNMIGMKTETVTEKFARQDAEFRAKHPQPAAPASAPAKGNTAIGDYAGMTAMQKREKAAGLKAGGMVKKKCVEGGQIDGPGGPTDDLVPIMASNGEFMIKASSAKILGQELLEALNDVGGKEEPKKGDKLKTGGMVRKMYKGGPVDDEKPSGIDSLVSDVKGAFKPGPVRTPPGLAVDAAINAEKKQPKPGSDLTGKIGAVKGMLNTLDPGKPDTRPSGFDPSPAPAPMTITAGQIPFKSVVGGMFKQSRLADQGIKGVDGKMRPAAGQPATAPAVQAAPIAAPAGAQLEPVATEVARNPRYASSIDAAINAEARPPRQGSDLGSKFGMIKAMGRDVASLFDLKEGTTGANTTAEIANQVVPPSPIVAGADYIKARSVNPYATAAPVAQRAQPTVDDSAIAATEAQKRASGQQGVAYNLNDPASNASILAQNPAGAVRKVGNSYSGSNVSGNVGFVGADGNPISGRPGGGYLTGGAPAHATQSLQNPDGSQWSEGDNAIMAENIRDGIDPTRGTSRGQHGGASIIGGPAIPGGDPNDLLSANHEAMRRANIAATRSGYRPEDKAMRAAGVSLVSGLGQQFGQAKQDQQANARTAMTTQATQAQTDATSRNQANANQIAQGQLGLNRQKQTQDNALARDKQATDTGMEKIKQQLWAAYTTGTPEQKAQAAEQLAMLSGKTQKADEYATDVVTDDKGVQRVVATNKRTGQQNVQQSAQAPHPDGTKLLGKDGKSYIVKNGVPVLN